jgi:hypothetical protein
MRFLERLAEDACWGLKGVIMLEGARLPPERRTAIRYRAENSSPLLSVVQEDRHRPAALQDLSSEGIGVLVERELEPGAVIRVEIHSRANHCWYLKKARVVHVRQAADGWLAGMAFVIKLDEADIPGLFAEYALVPAGIPEHAECAELVSV